LRDSSTSDESARSRAQTVFDKFCGLLDKYAGLKGYNKRLMLDVGDAGQTIMELLDRGFAGDMRALDGAESALRGLEGAYHLSPVERRGAIHTTIHQAGGSQAERKSEVQEILQSMRGPTGLKKYGDLILTAAITAAVTAIVTALVVRYVIGA
jgi:hypothetical protein